jgi:hypothetical protein
MLGCVLLGFAFIAVLLIYFSRPHKPVEVRLWDGSEMRLTQTDHGRKLCYDGAAWQRMLVKSLGIKLPIRNAPSVVSAFYTNGIALLFSHDIPLTAHHVWNGSAGMFCVSSNGTETLAQLHTVNFNLDKRTQGLITEELWLEIPVTHERELHMRLYETNRFNGVVSTNDFRMWNPAL